MNKTMRKIRRSLLVLLIGTIVLTIASVASAQDVTPEPTPEPTPEVVIADESVTIDSTEVIEESAEIVESVEAEPTLTDALTAISDTSVAVNTLWVFITGFLVFFMQAGFALLEAGLIRQTGVVNSLLENFSDAIITAISFWAVGFGIAFGTSAGGFIGTDNFFLSKAFEIISSPDGASVRYLFMGEANEVMGWTNLTVLSFFFFQYAFAATAGTIATGAMAERTDYIAKIVYTIGVGAFIYPVVVHWIWGGGWIASLGFWDFAGSAVVHTTGGIIALVGAWMLGPRANRKFGEFPPPHNMALATLGTMILWLGWYGFNPGSTLVIGDGGLVGLVALNTTLGAGAGGLVALFFIYFRNGRWDLTFTLNGSLAGLVAITAPCAYVLPGSAVIIGAVGGLLVILAVEFVELLKIDDPVGAFAVHGANGIWGTIAIGLFANDAFGTGAGLLVGGSADQLIAQLIGISAVVAWAGVTSFIMFGALKAMNRLRVDKVADTIGIDAYEHQASLWPDVFPMQVITKE